MDSLSTQEEMVLLAVGSQHPDAYAYGIQSEIKLETGKSISLGSIHTILYRLENQGLLKSSMGGSSAKRGGRSKRIYVLTSKGLSLIKSIRQVRQSMWDKISTSNLATLSHG